MASELGRAPQIETRPQMLSERKLAAAERESSRRAGADAVNVN